MVEKPSTPTLQAHLLMLKGLGLLDRVAGGDAAVSSFSAVFPVIVNQAEITSSCESGRLSLFLPCLFPKLLRPGAIYPFGYMAGPTRSNCCILR